MINLGGFYRNLIHIVKLQILTHALKCVYRTTHISESVAAKFLSDNGVTMKSNSENLSEKSFRSKHCASVPVCSNAFKIKSSESIAVTILQYFRFPSESYVLLDPNKAALK